MVDRSYPGVYIDESGTAGAISGVGTSTAGMVGVTDRGPEDARLVTSYRQFTEMFGGGGGAPAADVQARWTLDPAAGGQWWHLGSAVSGFFDNGGERLYVKRAAIDDPASVRAVDFVSALDAFENFDAVSILLAPGIWSAQVRAAMIAKCEAARRSFAVLDAPAGADIEQLKTFRAEQDSSFAALYYPWLEVLAPGTGRRVAIPPSGHVAGVFARIDREQGVFKAPVGDIRGVEGLARKLTQSEAQALNAEGIDTLRVLTHRAPLGRAHARRRRVEVCERAPPAGLVSNGLQGTRFVFEPNASRCGHACATRYRTSCGSCGGRADWPARRRNRHSSFAATVRR